jgi:hypothetical protein
VEGAEGEWEESTIAVRCVTGAMAWGRAWEWRNAEAISQLLIFFEIYTLSVCGVLGGGGYLEEALVVIV